MATELSCAYNQVANLVLIDLHITALYKNRARYAEPNTVNSPPHGPLVNHFVEGEFIFL